MTSIKFSKQTGMSSQSIALVRHFLEMRQYNTEETHGLTVGAGAPSFFLLTIRPEIREYMTANLFAEKNSQNRIREIDVLGVTAATSEQRVSSSKGQQVTITGTEEEFKAFLRAMEEAERNIEAERKALDDSREHLVQLAKDKEVEALKIPPSFMVPLTKLDIPRSATDFQNSSTEDTATYQKTLDAMNRVFDLLRTRIMKKIDADLEKKYKQWEKAAKLLEEDEDAFWTKYNDYADEDGNVDTEAYLAAYRDVDALHFWTLALSALADMGDTRRKALEVANSEEDPVKRQSGIAAVFEEYKKNKERSVVYDIQLELIKGLISAHGDHLTENLEGTDIIDEMDKLGEFYQTILEVIGYMDEERAKLALIEEYKRENKPIGRPSFQPIYEAEREQEKARLLGIPYVGFLTTYHDPLPDYSEIRYVPRSLRQWPNPEEVALLNVLDGMIIKQMTITDERIVGTGIASKTTRETREELAMVGYILRPGYMIKVKSIGVSIEADPYESVESKTKPNPNSLPSKNKSVEDYINHSTCFRERRRGKVYCIFYIEKKPYAADENHIYSLEARAPQEFAFTVPKQLASLYEYVSKASHTKTVFSEILRRLDEIYGLAQAGWKTMNMTSFHKLEELHALASKLTNENYSTFEQGLQRLTNATSGAIEERRDAYAKLDLYTYEALLYAFELSKVNMTQKEEANINYNDSTHTPDTYVTVSVRRPDDLFYNKTNGLPYDVMILRHNIFPRPLLSDLVQTTFTKKKKVKVLDSMRREKIVNPEYPDRVWSRRAKGFGTRKTDIPPLEVFDSSTMSKIIFCTPDDFALEVLTGPSLRIDDVITRLENLSRGKLVYKQYFIPSDINGRLAEYLEKVIANPLLHHYLISVSPSEITVGEKEKKLVQQALRGIAYTLYCKLSSSFGQLQDLTSVINSTSPVFNHCVFTHKVLERVNTQTPNSQTTLKKGDYIFKCLVESVSGEEVRLMPIRTASTEPGTIAFAPDAVRRTLQLGADEERADYYAYLEGFMRQETNIQKTWRREHTVSDSFKRKVEDIGVPDLLKAQVIARVIDEDSRDLSESAVATFIDAMTRKMRLTGTQSGTSISTSYGLEITMDGSTLSVNDTVLNERKTFPLPFVTNATISLIVKEVKETSFDEPFVGSMDMTFLTLLDHAMYPGEHTLLNRLHGIYHTYETGHFAREELGTFLWSELVEKSWPIETIKRIYHLISYQPRNLVLRTTERVTLREGRTTDMKATISGRRFIPWLISHSA